MKTNPAQIAVIRTGIIVALALWLAFYAGTAIADEDDIFLEGFAGLSVGAILWMLAGNNFWIYVVASTFLSGGFPILGNTTIDVVLSGVGICKYLVDRVVMVKTRLKYGFQPDFLYLCGFMSVVLVHAMIDRLGLRVLGSEVWGGRFYIMMLVSFVSYFIIISSKFEASAWKKLPTLILGIYLFDACMGILTAAVPSIIPVVGHIYDGISLTNYEDASMGISEDASGRIGAIGQFAFGMLMLIFARYNIGNLWRPNYAIAFFGTLFGVAGVLFGGFRSGVANTFFLFVAIGLRDLKARVVLLVAIAIGFLAVMPLVNQIAEMPLPVQRALAFLPGMRPEITEDADNSNAFRIGVWTYWYNNYFFKNWAFGRGFGFDPEFASDAEVSNTHNPFWEKQMIETGSIHNGLISSVDCVGVFGAFFFILWNITVFMRVFRYLYREHRQDDNPALKYLALYLFVSILSYWEGALNIGAYTVRQFLVVAVFNMLLAEQRAKIAEIKKKKTWKPNSRSEQVLSAAPGRFTPQSIR